MPLISNIKGENPQVVQLIGSINETANLEDIFAQLKGKVVFNLKGVEKINSIGIHRWIQQLEKYTQKNPVEVECLSYSLAVQAGSVLNLFVGAKINSTLAPYYCPKCEADHLAEVTINDLTAATDGVPEKRCQTCSTTMTFDELPSYFAFLKKPSGAR